MARLIDNSMKRARADVGRTNPIRQIKSRIRVGNVKENRRHTKLYNNKKWRALRADILALNPLCAHCGEVATTVDHIMPHLGNVVLFNDPNNLQSLCKPCHDRKTRAERKVPRMTSKLRPFPPPKPQSGNLGT